MKKVFQDRKSTAQNWNCRFHAFHLARYYRLIESFCALKIIPMVLNTSFNENEPAVYAPKKALDCFLRTQLDCLVIADLIIRRRPIFETSSGNW